MFEQVCEAVIAARIGRGDLVVALGGGVIGDLGGFVAAVVRRGLDYVQVPTTLLADVDSSVGGKTAIDSAHGKNLVGAFHQPILVLADTGAARYAAGARIPLRLCGGRQIRPAGRCRAFSPGWKRIGATCSPAASASSAREHAIAVSCRAKAGIVARDERELGERQLLNLGHTFGHALEAACGFSDRLLHGEAVAAGMALAFEFSSQRQGLLPAADAARAIRHLADVGLPTRIARHSGAAACARPFDGPDRAGQESETRHAYIHPGARHRRGLYRDRRRRQREVRAFLNEKLAER